MTNACSRVGPGGVDVEAFLRAVADRAGVPVEQAEALTRATFQVLAERISGGQAEDLAAHLPESMRDWLRPAEEPAEHFSPRSFVRRVSDRSGVPPEVATEGVRAVFATLREAVPEKEFGEMHTQLPEEYDELLA